MFLSLLVFPTKRDIVVGKFKSYGILPEALCDVASDFLFQKASRLVKSIFRDVPEHTLATYHVVFRGGHGSLALLLQCSFREIVEKPTQNLSHR